LVRRNESTAKVDGVGWFFCSWSILMWVEIFENLKVGGAYPYVGKA